LRELRLGDELDAGQRDGTPLTTGAFFAWYRQRSRRKYGRQAAARASSNAGLTNTLQFLWVTGVELGQQLFRTLLVFQLQRSTLG